jgi:tRNA 2-(methylsulfanyl)-N6-isopentenyladenosine37 hydroxylase
MKIKLVKEADKQVLGLKLPSDPRWVDMASISLEEILTDHAYCEQKAALAGISLISSYPEKEVMVRELAPIVTEEWGHFRQVLAEMDKRGLKLGRQRKDVYVNELLKFEYKSTNREERLVEKLLILALIEARSCERFRLLSLNMAQLELRDFYHKFMVSEAGHYKLYIELAEMYGNKIDVQKRWREYLDYEAEMIQHLEVRGDRIH